MKKKGYRFFLRFRIRVLKPDSDHNFSFFFLKGQSSWTRIQHNNFSVSFIRWQFIGMTGICSRGRHGPFEAGTWSCHRKKSKKVWMILYFLICVIHIYCMSRKYWPISFHIVNYYIKWVNTSWTCIISSTRKIRNCKDDI